MECINSMCDDCVDRWHARHPSKAMRPNSFLHDGRSSDTANVISATKSHDKGTLPSHPNNSAVFQPHDKGRLPSHPNSNFDYCLAPAVVLLPQFVADTTPMSIIHKVKEEKMAQWLGLGLLIIFSFIFFITITSFSVILLFSFTRHC